MSKDLSEFRTKIDELDNTIHNALMERMALVEEIAQYKKEHDLPFVQPAREAASVRRLLKNHKGALPEAALVQIWREMIGVSALLQKQMQIFVSVEEPESPMMWDLAKSYFGSVMPMEKAPSAQVALAHARDARESFAVLPWPQDEEGKPWWTALFDQNFKHNSDMQIVAALPFGGYKEELEDKRFRALVVSSGAKFLNSGLDHSFLILKVDQQVSRARIVDQLKNRKMQTLSIATHKAYHGTLDNLHLIEIKGFVDESDERVIDLAEYFEEYNAQCQPIGGYACAPVYKDNQAVRPQKLVLTAPPESPFSKNKKT